MYTTKFECHIIGLDGVMEERGRSLSVGQRQLFCVARAVLSSAKVVCVDEATANVDIGMKIFNSKL